MITEGVLGEGSREALGMTRESLVGSLRGTGLQGRRDLESRRQQRDNYYL